MQWNVPDQALIAGGFIGQTKVAAQAASIPGSTNIVFTGGYAAYGDNGGGLYSRSVAAPAQNGKFKSADGAYWKLQLDTNTPKQYGAKGNGVTVDTIAFTNMEADNSYRTVSPNTVGGLTINIDANNYLIGAITKRSYSWNGSGYDNTVLTANDVGVDFVTQSVALGNTGTNSSANLNNLTLDGASCRDILVIPKRVGAYGVDDRFRHMVRFRQGARYQINIQEWVNYHQSYNRHDNPGVVAIYAQSGATMNLSSFCYSNFTYDNNAGGLGQATTQGVAIIDNTADASNLGTITFEKARIEFNKNLAGVAGADPSQAFVFKSVCLIGRNQSIKWVLRDLDIQCVLGGACLGVFYRDAGGATTTSDTIFMENVQISGIPNLFTGDWPAWMKAITSGNFKRLWGDSINGIWAERVTTGGATGLEFYSPSAGTVETFRVAGAAFDAWQRNFQGTWLSGDGTVAPSVMMRPAGSTGWADPTDYAIKTNITLLAVGGVDLATTAAAVIDLQKRYSTLTRVLHKVGNTFGFLRN